MVSIISLHKIENIEVKPKQYIYCLVTMRECRYRCMSVELTIDSPVSSLRFILNNFRDRLPKSENIKRNQQTFLLNAEMKMYHKSVSNNNDFAKFFPSKFN